MTFSFYLLAENKVTKLTRRTPFLTCALAAVCLLACASVARAQAFSQSPLPPPTGFVNDFANVIDEPTQARMERVLVSLKQKADIEFAVVTVPTTNGQDIFNYSLSVARGWGIGSPQGEKKGLLLLVAVEDRKYQVQVSRNLEGDLPDGLVGELGRRMREPFRAGDYSTGLMNAVQTFIATIGKQRGFTFEEVDQSYAYQPAQRTRPTGARRAGGGLGLGACCLIGIVLVIIFSMFGGRRGGRGGGGFGGGGGGGLLNALLLANVVGSIANSGRGGSSGWGGESGSSGWGGGGGGFGGFGGGGDFGGGGAGGDW